MLFSLSTFVIIFQSILIYHVNFTNNTWSLYLHGASAGLTSRSEDVYGVWIDNITDDIYLTTRSNFTLNGLSGDGDDIFICAPIISGVATDCVFSDFWDGDATGFGGGRIDALYLGNVPSIVTSAVLTDRAVQDQQEPVFEVNDDLNGGLNDEMGNAVDEDDEEEINDETDGEVGDATMCHLRTILYLNMLTRR